MAQIRLDTGVEKFEFADLDGHVFARFSVNPTDINLAVKAQETAQYMAQFESETIDDAAKVNLEIENRIASMLGCDRADVFGEISATTVFPDGTLFVQIVLDKIIETVEPALKERQKKMQTASEKYLKKYEHGTVSTTD